MQKLLFVLLVIFRRFKDAALRKNAYFNNDFPRRCDSNAARNFPASFLKARILESFGLRLDSSILMLAAKPVSISVADFLMFLSNGSI